jgi:hypothetical protein
MLACGDSIKASQNTGIVTDGQPNLMIEISSIDFGELAYGSLGSESLTIRNSGTGILTIDTITVTTPFTTASVGGLEVQPSTSTPVTIQYIPTSYVDAEGSITIETNDPDEPMISLPIFVSVITDSDGDGYNNIESGGDDCNDSDSDVHPNAMDQWYDGVDSDCAGNDDFDQDNDGYQTYVRNEDPASGGGDCQDVNPEIYPGATDIWYDNIDSNCDGRDDFDQDNDGYKSLAEGRGGDCNDFDPTISPIATEALNAYDDNCDGEVDNDVAAWNSDIMFVGSGSGDKTGFHITAADLNEDGNDDIIVGSPGRDADRGHVSIFSGASLPAGGSTIDFAYNDFSAPSTASEKVGFYVGVLDDFDDSNTLSVAIGAPNANSGAGKIYLISADEAFYFGDLDDSYATITGSSGNQVGTSFAQDLDLNGDGMDDLFGYFKQSSNGYLYLFYGGLTPGDYNISQADARFATSGAGANMQRSFPNGGDIDGDGFDDIIFCDSTITYSYQSSQGSVMALWGGSEEYNNTNPEILAAISSTGSQNYQGAVGDVLLTGNILHSNGEACGIGPDWNGDGTSEIWVFYPGSEGTFTGAYMVPGSADLRGSIYNTRDAATTFISSQTSKPITGFRDVGDWDGDGVADVGVSFALNDFDSTGGGGLAWVIPSQIGDGNFTNSSVSTIEGDSDYNQAKYGNMIISRPVDVNGDGASDWIASDWGYLGTSGSSTNQGAIYISYHD